MIKKYSDFIKESSEDNNSGKYQELKEELKTLIQKTIDEEKQYASIDEFVKSFQKKGDIEIVGLINQDDVYQFYIDWRNDIDEVLNSINFFDEIPSEINAIGLYSYIIVGTKKAIQELVKTI